MHDSWRNPYIPQLNRMPPSVLDWGVNDAQTRYHPYWRNPFVTVADKDILVSLWQFPGRAMLGVFNYHGKQTKDPVLKLDLAKLGLAPGGGVDLAVRDLFGPDGAAAAAFDPASGTVTLKGLGPHGLRLVGVRATDKASLASASAQLAGLGNGAPAEFPAAALDCNLITGKTVFVASGRTAEIQSSEGIQVAAWRQPDRLLLAVINSGEQSTNAVLKVDFDALGLTPKLVWQEFVGVRDFNQGEKQPAAVLDFHGRTLTLKDLPPKAVRLVGMRKY
jgi:hypothetical protein